MTYRSATCSGPAAAVPVPVRRSLHLRNGQVPWPRECATAAVPLMELYRDPQWSFDDTAGCTQYSAALKTTSVDLVRRSPDRTWTGTESDLDVVPANWQVGRCFTQ
jgi:hypothetical protein